VLCRGRDWRRVVFRCRVVGAVKAAKKRNAQDATLLNIRPLKSRVLALERQVRSMAVEMNHFRDAIYVEPRKRKT
jgi:hypothetical protein